MPGFTKRVFFAADSLYPDLSDEGFHLPLRHLGLKLVANLKSNRLGKQYEYGGLIVVEGSIYCASMPDRLVNASIDRENKSITEDEYRHAHRRPRGLPGSDHQRTQDHGHG